MIDKQDIAVVLSWLYIFIMSTIFSISFYRSAINSNPVQIFLSLVGIALIITTGVILLYILTVDSTNDIEWGD